MNTRISFLFFSLFIVNQAFAQLESGSLAPNFVATDINGIEYNLYDLLDEGKIVVLDFYATWCEPCWDLHNEETLKDIWNQYGPDGTDEAYVFSIETDLSTGPDELNGIGGGTLGDWVTDVPYPIIDEVEGDFDLSIGQIARDYKVTYYPSVYVICPVKTLSHDILWQSTNNIFQDLLFGGCPGLEGENNIQIINYTGIEGAICNQESYNPKVEFQNLGNQNMTSATFDLKKDGVSLEEVLWTGDLSSYAIDSIIFSSIESVAGDYDIELLDVNSVIDSFPASNLIEFSIKEPNSTDVDTVIVEIMTDAFGPETYWAILDENNSIVAEGGNLSVGLTNTGVDDPPADPNAYDGEQLYVHNVVIPSDGCHRFVITDYFEDGFCCDFGNGFFRVTSLDNGILIDGSGDFEHMNEEPFFMNENTTSTTNIFPEQLQLSPNPFLDEISINLSNFNSPIRNVQISNSSGLRQEISISNRKEDAQNNVLLDLSNYNSGIYLMFIELEDGSVYVNKIIKV